MMAAHGQTLDVKLRRPATLKDCSFPPQGTVVLRRGVFYWAAGSLAFGLLIAVFLANIWAGMERSLVGRGDIESWIWRYEWWKCLLKLGWQQGIGNAIAVLLGNTASPCEGHVLDLALLSWPLEKIFGSTSYYNVKVALVLWLNCWSCWFVISRIWGANLYAWAGGLLFGLNSYFLNEIANGRVRSALAFAIPLCVWQLYLAYDHSKNERLDVEALIKAALFGVLSAVLYLPYGLALIVLLAIWWTWSLLSKLRKNQLRLWTVSCGVALLLGTLLYLPWTLPCFDLSGGSRESLGANFEYAGFPSAAAMDVAAKVQPAEAEFLSRDERGRKRLQLAAVQERFSHSWTIDGYWNRNYVLALPLVTLCLVIMPWGWNRQFPWLWAAVVGGCALLSMGPYIAVAGRQSMPVPLSEAILPYAWLCGCWAGFFAFDPWSMLAMLYFALALCLHARLLRLNEVRQGLAQVLTLVVIVAQIWQLYTVGLLPLSTTRLEVGPFCYLLGNEKSTGIIEVPWAGAYLDLSQKVHKCWSLGGAATRCVPKFLSDESRGSEVTWAGAKLPLDNAFILQLLKRQIYGGKWENLPQAELQKLRDRGYSLIILHERSCNLVAAERGEVMYFDYFSHLQKSLGNPLLTTFEPVYEDMPGRRAVDVGNPVWYRVAVFAI